MESETKFSSRPNVLRRMSERQKRLVRKAQLLLKNAVQQSPFWGAIWLGAYALALRLRAWRWQWLVVLPALGGLYVLFLLPFTPSISDIRKAKLERPAQVLSADGQEIAIFKRSNRTWVELDKISPAVIAALIATEDHRFYQHHGMDWWRTGASVIHTLRGDRQGGSTLTQQLARNLYPEEIGREASLKRKLKEAITAFKIEALYSKDEILETYLNTVPFLYNAWGIEMAARTYFDKSASKLSVVEAATLVGMLKGNSYYNPVRNPQRALARRNTVLSQMVKRGVLAPQILEQLQKEPLKLEFERQQVPAGIAPHFAQQVRRWLIDWADAEGYNIYTDGLVVHTTLDASLQAAAVQSVHKRTQALQAIANQNWDKHDGWNVDNPVVLTLVRESKAYKDLLKKGESEALALQKLLKDQVFMRQLRQDKTRVEAGFLALDPESGAVRAWVGSTDFGVDAYDHVQQARRQPGSTFKTFVYGAALQEGISPDDTRVDQLIDIELPSGEVWQPRDAAAPTGKTMPLRDALAYSKNTIAAQLMQEVGPTKVARLARNLGVRSSRLEKVPALALGASPVTLLEMTNSYSSLVRGGQYRAPWMVTRIEDSSGHVLAEFAPHSAERVMAPEDSYALLDMLRGVVDKGTARILRRQWGIEEDIAGKTGTTQNNADGWFILMHPQLVTGAWVGFNDARITLRSNYWGQGAHSALPIVGDVLSTALHRKVIAQHQSFAESESSAWWFGWGERLRSQWEALWNGDSNITEYHRKQRRAAGLLNEAQLPMAPQLQEKEGFVEESTPALPALSIPEQEDDPLDLWMQQWMSSESQHNDLQEDTDWLKSPPAVRARPQPPN